MKSLFSLLFGLFVLCSSAFAQEDSPDALIKKVTDDVLTIVRQDKDIQSGNTKKAIELVEAKVLPHFNFQRMTALAMGRDWNKASPEQKKRLSDEFRTLLVRTYSNALTSYRDQTIRYKPSKMQSGDTDVLVKTEIVQPGSKPVQLDYSLEIPRMPRYSNKNRLPIMTSRGSPNALGANRRCDSKFHPSKT